MAEMIPDSIGHAVDATAGERRVYNLLKSALLPDDEWIVWYEPCASIKSKHGDFLIFSIRHGMLLIEVKDWSASYIESASPSHFTIKNSNGTLQKRENPLKQARSVQLQIKNLLEKRHTLNQKQGSYVGKLRFPTSECVIFTGMERSQAEKIGLLDESILSHSKCLFQDDLRVQIEDKEDRNTFVEKLLSAFTYRFPFQPLNANEIKAVRYALFPELRINTQQSLDLEVVLNNDELIKVLDRQQEVTAKAIGPGHRILKGVAGSGKSLVIVFRARQLAQYNPNWRILVVCFNISLRSYLGATLNNAHIKPLKSSGNGYIEVKHYHSLLKDVTDVKLRPMNPKEKWPDYDAIRIKALEDYFKNNTNAKKYDAILVDEGQDFSEAMLTSTISMLSEQNSLLFCYDPAQNIFGKKDFTWKSVGMIVQGKKPTLLSKSYRNTRQIFELCTEFKGEDTEVDDENKSLIPDFNDCHEGDVPLLIQKLSFNEMVGYVAQDIINHVRNGVSISDCAVIIMESAHKRAIGDKIIPSLESGLIKLGQDEGCVQGIIERSSKLNMNLSHPSAKVLMTDSCKGLEFKVVYFLGLALVEEDSQALRKTAYVGMSRAKDYLTILYTKPNFYINELEKIIEKQIQIF